jgi:hypothetical protein
MKMMVHGTSQLWHKSRVFSMIEIFENICFSMICEKGMNRIMNICFLYSIAYFGTCE